LLQDSQTCPSCQCILKPLSFVAGQLEAADGGAEEEHPGGVSGRRGGAPPECGAAPYGLPFRGRTETLEKYVV